jgi:hypothetical protein
MSDASGWRCFTEREVRGKPSQIWAVLRDVRFWSDWDEDVDVSVLRWPEVFTRGAKGVMVLKKPLPHGGRVYDFTLEDVDEPRRFSYTTEFTGCTMNWYWDFYENPASQETFRMQVGVRAYGALSSVIKALYYKRAEKAINVAVDNMIKVMHHEVSRPKLYATRK